jgi:hypothetical protein
MWRMHASMHMGAATISMAGFPSSQISQLMPALDTDWPPLLTLPTNSTQLQSNEENKEVFKLQPFIFISNLTCSLAFRL